MPRLRVRNWSRILNWEDRQCIKTTKIGTISSHKSRSINQCRRKHRESHWRPNNARCRCRCRCLHAQLPFGAKINGK
uniref:Uncharacterized protein MANES_14G173400 n=1 Tax=Rhizophora mucronata TaxID=61149 RepID=A0A2P2IWZ8_RHIMU